METKDYLRVIDRCDQAIDAIQGAVELLNTTYGVGLGNMPMPHQSQDDMMRASHLIQVHLYWLKARAGVFALASEIPTGSSVKANVLSSVR